MINCGHNLGEKMQMDENPRPSKADRKTIEKNRRNQMKALYSELSILVPNHGPRETVSLPDQLEGATNYIKMMQAKLEEMKQKKMLLVGNSRSMGAGSGSRTGGGVDLPNIEIRVMGSTLELVLITGLNCQFMFNDIIRMLHEEGAEVVNASFSVLENTIFHTIHSKIGDSAQDYGAARISERLRKFVHDFS